MFSLRPNFFWLFWIILSSQASCQSNRKNVIPSFDLELKKTWTLENPDKIFPQGIKLSNHSLWFYNQFKQKIYQYDLNHQKLIREIPLKDFIPLKFARMVVQAYYPIHQDSLLIFFNAGDEPYYRHDSLMIMISLRNKSYSHLSIDSLPVICLKNPTTKNNHLWSFLSSNSYQLLQKNQILIPLKCFGGDLGDTSWNENKNKANLFIYDFEKQKVIREIPFEFPSKLGEYYPRIFTRHSVCWINEDLVGIAFQHTSLVYLYNLKTNQIINLNCKSYFIDTIPSFSEYVHFIERKSDDITFGKYMPIGYHPNGKYLYRLVRHPAPHDKYEKSVYSLVLYDLKNAKIYENFLPDNINIWSLIPYEKGFLVFDETNSNIQEGKYLFSYYEIKPTSKKLGALQITRDSLYKSYEVPEDFKKYWEEVFHQPLKEGNYLLIPIENSCIPCLGATLKKLENEKNKWCNSNLKVIIIGLSSILEEKYRSLGMEVPKDCYYFDFNKKLLRYMKSFINFRLISIDENEQIIEDRILNPQDLPMLEKLLNSIEQK